MKQGHRWTSYFFYFLLFNGCFLGLQISLVYGQNHAFVGSLPLPTIVLLQLLSALGSHLFLYLLLSLFQTFLLYGIVKRSWHRFSPDQWQIIIWSLCACALLSANAYYFPLSLFSKLLSPPLPKLFLLILLIISGSMLILLLVNSLFSRTTVYLIAATSPLVFSFLFYTPHSTSYVQQTNTKPNIIFLGIDSLSLESVTPQSMPFFSKLLNNSTQFTHSISPLARTYPAWSSILTGLYTQHHHAEENLVAKNTVRSDASIAWTLRKQGYDTFFASDDRCFNSVGKEFGFNKIIGPPLGVNSVLLGTFNDFPLSNLLINLRATSWLFPYNYSNRASFFSYYPQTFSQQLRHELNNKTNTDPIFLAVHFTLPHWPYAWAESRPEQVNNEFSIERRNFLYQHALKRVDKQFQSFFTYLEQQNYFKNCLLVLLSDHGEVLYYPGSRLTSLTNYQGQNQSKFAEYLKQHTATVLNKSAGHGSDILSPKQYHNILAFRIYQNEHIVTSNKHIDTRVALIDLAPTILDFLHTAPQQKMDGISLLSSIQNPFIVPAARAFFIESGIYPNQLITKQKSIKIGKFLYQVNPISGELEIKADKMKRVSQQKLYGIIQDNWVLALYPDKKNYIPVIQNLQSGAWSDDLHSDFAQTTPANQMLKQMQQFYGKQLFLPIPQ